MRSSIRSSGVREALQKQIGTTRLKLRRLDEAFIFNGTIDRATYDEQRDRLREELTLAELELSDTQIEQFDVDGALANAGRVLLNA